MTFGVVERYFHIVIVVFHHYIPRGTETEAQKVNELLNFAALRHKVPEQTISDEQNETIRNMLIKILHLYTDVLIGQNNILYFHDIDHKYINIIEVYKVI